MKTLSTTKMSSKGQVVIPENVREDLGLKTGSQFVVVGEKDVVILKSITPPSMKDFDSLIKKARKQAKESKMKRSDVKSAIKKVRKSK
jgi:AbrB family looped-hinge helix DNA binding protein